MLPCGAGLRAELLSFLHQKDIQNPLYAKPLDRCNYIQLLCIVLLCGSVVQLLNTSRNPSPTCEASAAEAKRQKRPRQSSWSPPVWLALGTWPMCSWEHVQPQSHSHHKAHHPCANGSNLRRVSWVLNANLQSHIEKVAPESHAGSQCSMCGQVS